MLDNSFTFWLVNLGITTVWLVVAIASGNWFFALGGVIFIVIMMLVQLPGTSSEEGSSAEEPDSYDDGIE
jgi:hypothetical protein